MALLDVMPPPVGGNEDLARAYEEFLAGPDPARDQPEWFPVAGFLPDYLQTLHADVRQGDPLLVGKLCCPHEAHGCSTRRSGMLVLAGAPRLWSTAQTSHAAYMLMSSHQCVRHTEFCNADSAVPPLWPGDPAPFDTASHQQQHHLQQQQHQVGSSPSGAHAFAASGNLAHPFGQSYPDSAGAAVPPPAASLVADLGDGSFGATNAPPTSAPPQAAASFGAASAAAGQQPAGQQGLGPQTASKKGGKKEKSQRAIELNKAAQV